MLELIKIEKLTRNNEEILTVNARELWEVLEVKDKFADWIERQLERGKFVEERDFVVIRDKPKNPQGGRPATEYHLTIDTAKHIGMMSNTAQGIKVREYFIECEKIMKQAFILPDFTNPAIAARAWADEVEKKMLAEAKVKELEPKAEFFDAVTGSNDAIDIGTVAKVLNMGIGRNSLFEFLRNEKVLMGDNQPMQRHVDSGYFRLIEQKYVKPDGSTHISIKTVVYQKGVEFIRRLLLKAEGGGE